MKGRGGAYPPDLLVCFPSRAHLALMPKPICSPSRPTDPFPKRHPHHHNPSRRGQASPLFKTKSSSKPSTSSSSEIEEPTSPKVTCAGQIRVKTTKPTRPKTRNWASVMDEMERLRRHQKRPHWLDSVGLKKDVMQFLNVLRGLRFNMRCFGSFHGHVESDEDDEDDDEEEDEEKDNEEVGAFSKWFMVLQENEYDKETQQKQQQQQQEQEQESCVAPSNALLLMRCRSAPPKGWLEEEEKEKVVVLKEEEEKEKDLERLVLMSYAPDFFKVSSDIAKETWVVGRTDGLVRSRSWKR
ncbi:hypothetical protein QJS10_CPA06g02045 [Acorus calamus]|uniref:Uncharacterized protein n=1 Tax=Acorus calamus TaxID=4465 RepID=A0AAV9EL82_ACOCL|nr:hypothetical protein QJS10_CPA06g02045 [Acorus calamus]